MYSEIVKNRRKALGITQSKLAESAGLSLLSIQNLESQKKRPNIESLIRVLHALGLELEIQESFNPDVLWALGLPLQPNEEVFVLKTKENLIKHLREAAHYAKAKEDERVSDIVLSTLIALKEHFPKLYKAEIQTNKLLKELAKKEILGRHIKLKRMIVANLSEYL